MVSDDLDVDIVNLLTKYLHNAHHLELTVLLYKHQLHCSHPSKYKSYQSCGLGQVSF